MEATEGGGLMDHSEAGSMDAQTQRRVEEDARADAGFMTHYAEARSYLDQAGASREAGRHSDAAALRDLAKTHALCSIAESLENLNGLFAQAQEGNGHHGS